MYIINYTKRFKKSLEKLKKSKLKQSEINERFKRMSYQTWFTFNLPKKR